MEKIIPGTMRTWPVIVRFVEVSSICPATVKNVVEFDPAVVAPCNGIMEPESTYSVKQEIPVYREFRIHNTGDYGNNPISTGWTDTGETIRARSHNDACAMRRFAINSNKLELNRKRNYHGLPQYVIGI